MLDCRSLRTSARAPTCVCQTVPAHLNMSGPSPSQSAGVRARTRNQCVVQDGPNASPTAAGRYGILMATSYGGYGTSAGEQHD